MKADAPEADPDCDDVKVLTRARIALACVCEPGEPGLADVIASRGPSAVVAALLAGRSLPIPRAAAIGARLAELDLADQLARAEELGCRIVLPGDLEWPGRLDDLGPQRPLALWCWGEANVRLHAVTSISIVGARACTRYGEMVAREWSACLAGENVTIVSGGAYGIDAAAHRGALSVDGSTICVLAGGVDQPYPRGHEGLFSQIMERGVLVSEAPLGETVRRQRFLTRNRLIAALTSATCVVEAAHRSGSARTASFAADLHRPVLAVPGPVTSETSVGTHRLITEQIATLAADVQDLRDAVGPVTVVPIRSEAPRMPRRMRQVLDALPGSGHRGMTKDAVAVRSGIDPDETSALLERARAHGHAELTPDGLWVFAGVPQRG